MADARELCIYDRIHGRMVFPPVVATLIDTDEFQRLDQIRQLGVCSFLYPSATHTRKEHSLGVAHLAGVVGRRLGWRPEHVLCLEIAGLLHDLGHGPFSHLFESVAHEYAAGWSHEVHGFEMMFTRMLSHARVEDALRRAFERAAGPEVPLETHVARIRHMIRGLGTEEPVPDGCERALFDVVCCRRNGVDVDKMDYLLRDSVAVLQTSNVFSIDRIVSSLRVADERLCFDEAVACEVVDLLTLRARMHRQVYQHRTVLLWERAVRREVEAVLSADPSPLYDRDAFLAHVDYVYHARAARAGTGALARRHGLTRVPLVVSLNVAPRCAACRTPLSVDDRVCPTCGAHDRSLGAQRADGAWVAPETLLTARDVEAQLAVPGLVVSIADITIGTPVLRHDPHGRAWLVYDPVHQLSFHRGARRLVGSEASLNVPQRTRERLVYVHSEDRAPDALARAEAAVRAWARGVSAA